MFYSSAVSIETTEIVQATGLFCPNFFNALEEIDA
jgi:hypothetical protein